MEIDLFEPDTVSITYHNFRRLKIVKFGLV